MYELRFDGLFRSVKDPDVTDGCAGVMCIGWLVTERGRLIAHGYGALGRGVDATSNIAEYLALIDGLQALQDMGAAETPVRILGDAKAVIDQMRGSCKVSTERVFPLYDQASRLAASLTVIAWEWVPRKKNKAADKLSRLALRQFRANPQEVQTARAAILRDHKSQRDRLHDLGGLLVFQGGAI